MGLPVQIINMWIRDFGLRNDTLLTPELLELMRIYDFASTMQQALIRNQTREIVAEQQKLRQFTSAEQPATMVAEQQGASNAGPDRGQSKRLDDYIPLYADGR